jgi:hypothetical protein
MDSGGGYLYEEEVFEPNGSGNQNERQELIESRHLEKMDEAYIKLIRKYRKR